MAPESFDIGFKNQKPNLDFPMIFDNPFAKIQWLLNALAVFPVIY